VRNVFVLMLAAVVTAPLAAQAPTSARGADSAFARGDWAAALTGYRDLVTRDSLSPAPWLRIGIAEHGLGKYREAVTALSRARRLGAQPLMTELRLARAQARLGDQQVALAHLDSVARLAPPGMMPQTVRDEPDFADMRGSAAFGAIIARLEATRYPCRAKPESRQLDFWIGEWDVAPWNGPPGMPVGAAGFNSVQPILEQCVLLENWRASGGGEGKSFNFFDTNSLKWRQIWIADGGGTLDYSGEFRDGAMRFEGWTRSAQGGRVMQKLTFTPYGRDTVRQTFEASPDSGKTWNVTFDARYVRRKGK
jgi:hypothetical protein